MFDFVRKTRAPFHRQMHEHDHMRSSVLYRLTHFHPRLFVALLLFLCSLVFGMAILHQRSSWDGKQQRGFLVVFGNEKDVPRALSLVVIHGAESTATVLNLPTTLELETLRGYGLYKSSSLYGLAALEKLPLSFVTQTVTLQFGIDISDIIWVHNTNTSLTGSKFAGVFLSGMLLRDRSTFGMADRYRLWRFFSSLRKDQFSSIDLSSSSVLKPVEKGGGSGGEQLLQLDPVRLDPLIFELFSNDAVRKENTAVAIVNTTGELRLGTRIARALSNMGVDVISVTSTGDSLAETQLVTASGVDEESNTAELVQRVLLLKKEQTKKNPEKALEYRADLVLFLGKDIAELYSGTDK